MREKFQNEGGGVISRGGVGKAVEKGEPCLSGCGCGNGGMTAGNDMTAVNDGGGCIRNGRMTWGAAGCMVTITFRVDLPRPQDRDPVVKGLIESFDEMFILVFPCFLKYVSKVGIPLLYATSLRVKV